MNEKKYTIEVLGKTIEAAVIDTGCGINCLIAGGDRAHIGAVSVKYPGCDLKSITFENHKEAVISDKWALALCETLNAPASVSCGIHYDNLTKAEIEEIVSETDKLLKKVITCLEK